MTFSKRYDVFLSHNSADEPAVELLARKLREAGIEPFLDRWHLVPGNPWQEALEEALQQSLTCAVFLGPQGLGTWENEEMRAALDSRAHSPEYRVIPVLLPGASLPERGRLPLFLARLTWVDFRAGLDGPWAFQELMCGIQGTAPGPGPAAESTAICPFRGLDVFDEEHAPYFFGREALTQYLLERLRDDRFLAVIGASGSGKSSLVRAGLVPRLRAGALPGSDRWPVVILKPGAAPLETLAAKLVPHVQPGSYPLAVQGSLLGELKADERGLHKIIQVALAAAPDSRRLLLVVDQFEEVFAPAQDRPSAIPPAGREAAAREAEGARAGFIANLLYASAIAGGQVVVVLTMRADFYGHCAAYPNLSTRLAERNVLVGPMSEAELRLAMEGPACAANLHFEKGLVDTLVGDLGSGPGMLPLLEYTLLELWQRRRGCWLTTDAYKEVGGVRGALANRANAVYAGLTPAQQASARRVLLRLTELGEGAEDTRRRATLAELKPSGREADVEAVVRQLADARLLTTTGTELPSAELDSDEAEMVEVSHEALIRCWPLLRGWIDDQRAGLRTQRRLTEAAEEWKKNGYKGGDLYRGARLATAAEWAAKQGDSLNELERRFLHRSTIAVWKRRIATVGGTLAALAVMAAVIVLAVSGRFGRWFYPPLPADVVTVPAGEFGMGSSPQELEAVEGGIQFFLAPETPDHLVALDAFEIWKYEVTNRQYLQCFRAGVCNPPSNKQYDRPGYEDHPVADVDWQDGADFCAWNGGSLPSEAQWEKAARARPEGALPQYPWGDDRDPGKANVAGEASERVGSHSPGGDSYYGAADMAGNVWEWVADWYAEGYYSQCAAAPSLNPAGPAEGTARALRGGSFANGWVEARSTYRLFSNPGSVWPDLGFRCVRRVQP